MQELKLKPLLLWLKPNKRLWPPQLHKLKLSLPARHKLNNWPNYRELPRSKKLPDLQLRLSNRESLLSKPQNSLLSRLSLLLSLKLPVLQLRLTLPELLRRLPPLRLLALLPNKKLPESLLSRLPLLLPLRLHALQLKRRLLELLPNRLLLKLPALQLNKRL